MDDLDWAAIWRFGIAVFLFGVAFFLLTEWAPVSW